MADDPIAARLSILPLFQASGERLFIFASSSDEVWDWLAEIQRADYEIFMPNNESRAQTQILEVV